MRVSLPSLLRLVITRRIPRSSATLRRRLGAGRTAASERLVNVGKHAAAGGGSAVATLDPPIPPIVLTPLVACDPETDTDVLWHIARHAPELRRWLVANARASAELMEYVAQAGGPGVNEALEILLGSLERESG